MKLRIHKGRLTFMVNWLSKNASRQLTGGRTVFSTNVLGQFILSHKRMELDPSLTVEIKINSKSITGPKVRMKL